ncbi:TPA: hypothetical protein ACGUXP_004106 [Vibrio vulnificus]
MFKFITVLVGAAALTTACTTDETNSTSSAAKPLPPASDSQYYFGVWEASESSSENEINIANSQNGVYRISVLNKSVNGSPYQGIFKISQGEQGYTSQITLIRKQSSNDFASDYIEGSISISHQDAKSVVVSLYGVFKNTGEKIVIEDRILNLTQSETSGRIANLVELNRNFLSLNGMDFSYLGNSRVRASSSVSGCEFEAQIKPSGFTIFKEGSTVVGEYDPWAFDFEIVSNSSNCLTLPNQAGTMNFFYKFDRGFDEMEIETYFSTNHFHLIALSPLSERPPAYQ